MLRNNPSEEGVDVLEDGIDEELTAKFGGGSEVGGEADAVQGGQHGVECLAELDGSKVFGAFVDPGLGEGFKEGGEELEIGGPGDPLRERFGVVPGQEEAPLTGAD